MLRALSTSSGRWPCPGEMASLSPDGQIHHRVWRRFRWSIMVIMSSAAVGATCSGSLREVGTHHRPGEVVELLAHQKRTTNATALIPQLVDQAQP